MSIIFDKNKSFNTIDVMKWTSERERYLKELIQDPLIRNYINYVVS